MSDADPKPSQPDSAAPQMAAEAPLAPTGIYSPLDSASELVRVLDQFLADLQAGKAPDKAALLADHPELAAELDNCLAGIEFVHRAAKPQAGAPSRLGDFRIVREVGRGGMGVVYEAEQLSLKRKVALKVLRFGVTADQEVMKRFQREAETVAHLHHTNIVPIHAVGCEQGVHYYAMQFIEGKSLATVAAEADDAGVSGDVPPARFHEVAGWMLQAAEALAHAHQRGVIHRDIKPSNLILDPEGTVWLTDFGLAKRADEVTLTAAGVLMGTPRYMSPEQAASTRQPIDHRTDIYSLGATLYELATGKPVFDSQTPQGVITQILNADPVPPRVVQGAMPRDLETIILKCLAKEPAQRYQAARDLADDLRAFLENRPLKARRASLVERAARWSRKHKRSTAVSAATAVVSVLVITGAYVGWNAYQESLNGRLTLTTDGPALVAEVLNSRDELVLPSFPVPTPQPAILPAGSYHVRVSGSGQLSETWQIDVERGRHQSLALKLIDRSLGPSLEVLSRDPPVLFELNGQAHWLLGGERGWRVVNGATSQSPWPGDLKLADTPIVPTDPNTLVNQQEWRNLLSGYSATGGYLSPATGQSPGLALPAFDLDGDGRHDLVFASRVSPSLLAVSANDGHMLWWYRAAPNLPPEYDPGADPLDHISSSEGGGVIGTPIIVDIAGTQAVVAMFVSFGGNFRTRSGKSFTTPPAYHLEAVAALTGKSIWKVPLKLADLPPNYDRAFKRFATKPEVIHLAGLMALLLHVNQTLLAFDMQTGRELWACDLGLRPVEAPHLSDLDGDGQPEALCVFHPQARSDELTLRAVALISRTTLWERTFMKPGFLNQDEWRQPGDEVVSIYDLDADGRPEVIIPVRDDWAQFGKHWFGVEALAGATGQSLWQRRLWSMGFSASSGSGGSTPVRFIAGPDLDHDGRRELYAASLGSIRQYPHDDIHYLQVDALSGKDGHRLWRWRQKSASDSKPFEPTGRLQWWQAGQDGWPLLVVPVRGAGGQAVTYLLESSSGRMTQLLPEVADPQVADVNSDGILDLFHLAESRGARRLIVSQGAPPVKWRRAVEWQAAGDYDGDGIADFREWGAYDYGENRLTARSGADGHILWQVTVRPDTNANARSRTIDTDVNGDQVPDVVVLEQIANSPGNVTVVSAFSGRDGKRLWTAADIGLQSGSSGSSGGGPQNEFSYPLLDQHDLDGDGRPEILIAAHIDYSNGIQLAALANTDGHLLWKVPILKGAYTGSSLIDRHLWHDLDGDGVLDTIIWTPKSIGEYGVDVGTELRAVSGRDGKRLWKEAPELAYEWPWWPRTAIADLDGDGAPDVVVTTHDYKGQNELAVLDAASGKLKWNRTGQYGGYGSCWPPLLVNMDGDGRRMICLGIQESTPGATPNNIVVLDPVGNVRHRIPTGWNGPPYAWTALDADGDGKEELLYVNDGVLHAYRGSDQRDLWNRPGSHGIRLDEYRAGRSDQAGMLAAWSDRTIIGLNVATGEARWRCDVPRTDNYQLVASLSHSASGNIPLVATRFQGTLAQQAWPTNAAGKYLAPDQKSLDLATFADPDLSRPLPWNQLPWDRSSRLGLINISLFLVFLGTLAYWIWQGRRWCALLYLLGALVIAMAVGAVLLWNPSNRLEAHERYAWDGWYWILFIGGFGTGQLTALYAIGHFGAKFVRRRILRAS